MSFISITISGDVETVAYFKRVGDQIEPVVLIPSMRDWASALRDAMIEREHYRSGRMRSMTKVSPMGKYWSVLVDVDYAETENSRKGNKRGKKGGGQGTPHRFAEPAMKQVDKPQFNNLLNRLTAFLASG